MAGLEELVPKNSQVDSKTSKNTWYVKNGTRSKYNHVDNFQKQS